MRSRHELSSVRAASLAGALSLALALVAGPAQAQRPVVAAVPAAEQPAATIDPQSALNSPPSVIEVAEPGTSTLVIELRERIQGQRLTELRTTYNGAYGASLLFEPETLTYYVTLFQQRDFWRAYKTTDYAAAETRYRAYAGQSEQLAAVDIERIRLEAEQAHITQRIAQESEAVQALRGNLAFQQRREREVQAQQAQAREQARILAAQQKAAEQQLDALRDNLRSLQAQQEALLQADIAGGEGSRPARR